MVAARALFLFILLAMRISLGKRRTPSEEKNFSEDL
jgi:hypothetical protein